MSSGFCHLVRESLQRKELETHAVPACPLLIDILGSREGRIPEAQDALERSLKAVLTVSP